MAYTKYSLTPANNTAAPPDGAPEGMLPSAVNDTMRDMMAQIRDCGDGIRDGTYTMTAPKITGGTITGAAFTGNTFTSPVISGGSINNTPIGGTTAAAGAFTTLSATGVTTVQAGTVSLPAITTTGDTNTGIYFPAADTIAFTEGGAEAMRIDSSGNVGIGLTPPVGSGNYRILNVGATVVYGNTGLAVAALNNNADINDKYVITGVASSYTQSSGNHLWYSAVSGSAGASISFTERMRIDSSGNVGIGNTSASSFASTTNLALGTGSSSAALTVYTGTAQTGAVYFADGTTSADRYRGAIEYTHSNNALLFTTDASERMRIDSSGNVIMGNTSWDYSVNGFGFGAGNSYSYFTRTSGFALGVNRKTTTGELMAFWYNGSGVGNVSTNGSNCTFNSTSDYRLKQNIQPMTGALARVNLLKPVTYNWIRENQAGEGFIAHELQEVVPEAVTGTKDAVDEDGNPVYQAIDQSVLVATLTAALQELNAKVDAQAVRIAELESK